MSSLAHEIGAATAVFNKAGPLLDLAPKLLGYPGTQRYLILLQNSDEMRPTGGFIGAYGVLGIKEGQIVDFSIDDTYNLDRLVSAATRPDAPAPIQTYLAQRKWYLRDANWSPDFPTSARTIMQFYKEEARDVCQRRNVPSMIHDSCLIIPDQIDGVIAIMPEMMKRLLAMVGPVTVSGQTFTAENFTDALEYEVEIKFDEKGVHQTQRKAIISELGHALIAKFAQFPAIRWPEVVNKVSHALDEKQVLVYARDAGTEAVLDSYGWSGKINDASMDYLGVFDANMFSLKTDPYVTRSIFYRVRQEVIGMVGEVELVYSYPKSGPAWKTKGYRSWTRVYVPKGSILTEAKGAMKEEGSTVPGEVEISQEFGKTVFGAFLAVEVGEVKRLKFKYRLPEAVAASVRRGRYELYVQKQPGTIGHSLTVGVDFGKVPATWSPTDLGAKLEDARITWQTSLRRDQGFHIEF